MGFKKSELLEEIKHTRIDFPNGKFLDIDFRVRAMPYGKKAKLLETAFGAQGMSKRLTAIGKDLENRSLGEVERERLEAEQGTIRKTLAQFMHPLVDYLGGTSSRPPAIAAWDLLGDNDEPLPVTREEIEDLDEETISFIAWQLLGATDVGEAKGASSEPSSPSAASGAPV